MILNNNQVWVVVAIESDTRKMRFDIINTRNGDNLKIFVFNHIGAGTLIISDN